jgi:hypothetical protein
MADVIYLKRSACRRTARFVRAVLSGALSGSGLIAVRRQKT